MGHGAAIAGSHLTRQLAGTGLPYFARELVAGGVTALLHQHSGVAIGLQAGLLVAGLGVQAMRVAKDMRNPQEAARATAGVSTERWAAMSDADKQPYMTAHKVVSGIQACMQATGSSINLAMAVQGHLQGKPEMAAAALATEIKSIVFSVLRDTSQATFSMVGTDQPTVGALHPGQMAAAAGVYGAMQGLLGLASDAARSTSSFATKTVFDAAKNGFAAVAAAAAVKATANTVIEGVDDATYATLDAHRSGARQTVAPSFNFPPPDGARLMDQTPARHAFLNTFLSTLNLVDAKLDAGGASHKARSLIGNGAAAALGALLYPTTVSLWQGSAAVRTDVRAARNDAAPAGGLEMV